MITSENIPFLDYLQLKNTDLSQTRLLVFSGKSGTGKSTYIDYLTKHNACLNKRSIKNYSDRPMNWKSITNKRDTLVIDEVKSIFELYYIIKLLVQGNTLLVANHVPTFLFRLIGLFTTTAIFIIDKQPEKLTFYLNSHGYQYSHSTIESFCKTFGSNYKILKIILETTTKPDFDSTYYHFIRFNKIQEQAL